MNNKNGWSKMISWIPVTINWIQEKHNALNLILTFAAFWVGYSLLKETQRSVNVATEALRFQRESDSMHAVSQSKKDSVFALYQERRDSLATASSRADLRAYFHVRIDKPYLVVGQPVNIGIEFKNVGKTPAYNFSYQGATRIGTGVYKFDIDEMEKNKSLKTDQTISPGQIFYGTAIPRNFIWTVNDSVNIFSGRFKLNSWGRFLYTDIFGKRRFIHYCVWYNRFTGEFTIYEHYNDAN